tara:strand:- start:333 stop:473 length:141 start_codon:yes stop_codon:yes gene_type:complete
MAMLHRLGHIQPPVALMAKAAWKSTKPGGSPNAKPLGSVKASSADS